MLNRSKSGTLSDKISELLTSVPRSFDPEDDVHEETVAKVVDHEDDSDAEENDTSLSKFRKQNIDLLEDVDKRYVGEKKSRKDLKDSEDEWETEEEGLSTDEGEALDGISGTRDYESDDDESDQSGNESKDEDEGVTDDVSLGEGKFVHVSSGSSQLEKGVCVRNQLNVWESLLEVRIQLQKALIVSNKLPQQDTFRNLSAVDDSDEFKTKVNGSKKIVSSVLDKLLTLQSLLLKRYPETKSLGKATAEGEDDEEIPSDTEEESSDKDDNNDEEVVPKKRRKLEEYEADTNKRHNLYTNYRNSVIQKWHDKTKLLSGKNSGQQHSVVNQINFLLNDKEKLIKRTQLKRSQYDIVGRKRDEVVDTAETDSSVVKEEYDRNIFDDDDFYHHLLRELIEFKSADLTDPVQLGRQWIELQNLRSKMKRKIDTKATKGRKLRYAVHSKLVNFMAPIEENSTWTDDAKTELFNSLFGKNQIKDVS